MIESSEMKSLINRRTYKFIEVLSLSVTGITIV